MSRSFRRFLARNRRNRVIAGFARRAQSYVRGYGNFDYDPRYNGEGFLLETLAGTLAGEAVLFDVGANRGDWTSLALDRCPNATVHAFELVPDTAAQLRDRVGNDPRVRVNPFGLADRSGILPVKIAVGDSTRSTLVLDAALDAAETDRICCPVRTGDGYMAANGIDRVHLLKIDAEGGEPAVLEGLSHALADGRIDAIQFEYGRANLATRFLLTDFYALLVPLGFELGKLYPNYVDFKDYSPHIEDFLGPNQVAVHRRCAPLRARLAG